MIVSLAEYRTPKGFHGFADVDIPDDCKSKVDEITEAGCRLTCEILTTGHVSICIEHPENGDFDSELVANGPSDLNPNGPPDAVARIIRRFDRAEFDAFVEETS